MERTCRGCGCTDANACVTDGQPCHWVEPDLCSTCDDKAKLLMKAGLQPGTKITDAEIVGVRFLLDGRTATRLKLTLETGSTVEMDWPGTYTVTVTDPVAHYSIADTKESDATPDRGARAPQGDPAGRPEGGPEDPGHPAG